MSRSQAATFWPNNIVIGYYTINSTKSSVLLDFRPLNQEMCGYDDSGPLGFSGWLVEWYNLNDGNDKKSNSRKFGSTKYFVGSIV